jgi:hypothetical protein
MVSIPWPGHEGETPSVNYTAAQAAVQELNYYRAMASAPPVTLDYQLSLACQLHANYMGLNHVNLRDVGLAAHHEYPGMPGYSAEGAAAAMNSVIYQGVGPVTAVDNWMSTFYHRLGLLDVNLGRIGFGSAGDYQVMDAHRGRLSAVEEQQAVALFPAPGMSGVPTLFVTEIPYPIPGDTNLGVPITVEFSGPYGLIIEAVQAELIDDLSGSVVPCYIQTPGEPFLPGWDYQQVICLIPRDPLPRGARQRVVVSAEVSGTPWNADWTFTTR